MGNVLNTWDSQNLYNCLFLHLLHWRRLKSTEKRGWHLSDEGIHKVKLRRTNLKKNSYRKRIKVRWCRDSILQKKFWKFIPHTHVYPSANLRTPAHNHAHPCTPMHTRTHPRTLSHTRTHPPNTHAYLHTPGYTCAHRTHTPHIPADADFGLINHM